VPDTQVSTFDVEGQPVSCYQTGEDRLWRCECAHFQRTLATYKQGFCAHIVVAIERTLRDGVIDYDAR
jgi:hypothetical protein